LLSNLISIEHYEQANKVNQKTNYRIWIENTDDENEDDGNESKSRKENRFKNKLDKKKEESIIVLSDDEERNKEYTLNSNSNKNYQINTTNNEVDDLVGALGNINIQSVEKNFQTLNDQQETRKKIDESPLPFHLRMKSKFNKASIFQS
jgi:hypothetical protein